MRMPLLERKTIDPRNAHLPFTFNLSERNLQPEIMDQADLDESAHHQALRGLQRLNFWSGSARILWRPIYSLTSQIRDRPIRILDLACGAGDVPLRLWRKAQRAGVPLEIDGWDVSPRAIQCSKQIAIQAGADMKFFIRNALKDDIPPHYDAIVCSLFLHHLAELEAVRLLQRMAAAARHLVLVNDLLRHPIGLLLAQVATQLLTRSFVVHVDGPRSVAGAFSMAEAQQLAERAGLRGATVSKRWPFRYLLSWRRP